MKNKKVIKIIGLIVIIVMIANLILFAAGVINIIKFWVIIITGAIITYKIIPLIKK
ncbi:hypothetical protein J4216_00645 [Candidatus Woesearchaeota archaeon]|nr:hypothetical protein [Candidatus Woesearchaeota archaeon]